ncbi:hypothetical protein GCM10022240_11710 [Microbacterium kribbense]|uniref:Uncharacterized protein n=1 Tax=Microbacterium kribbense TaxID=433645 RepID=A0ABP7GBE8_9MICO
MAPGLRGRPRGIAGDVLVQIRADPRHLGLADPGVRAERLHEIVDLPSRDTVDVGLHHDREQRLIDPPAPFQQRRVVVRVFRRVPLRCITRPGVRSNGAAPMKAAASALDLVAPRRFAGRLDQCVHCLGRGALLQAREVEDAATKLDETDAVLGELGEGSTCEPIKIVPSFGEKSQHLPWSQVCA